MLQKVYAIGKDIQSSSTPTFVGYNCNKCKYPCGKEPPEWNGELMQYCPHCGHPFYDAPQIMLTVG